MAKFEKIAMIAVDVISAIALAIVAICGAIAMFAPFTSPWLTVTGIAFLAWIAAIVAIVLAVVIAGAVLEASSNLRAWMAEHAERKAEQLPEDETARANRKQARVIFAALLVVVLVAALLITPRVIGATHAQSRAPIAPQDTPLPMQYLAHCTPQGNYKLVATDSDAVVNAERAYGFWQIPASFYAEIYANPSMICDAGPNDLGQP